MAKYYCIAKWRQSISFRSHPDRQPRRIWALCTLSDSQNTHTTGLNLPLYRGWAAGRNAISAPDVRIVLSSATNIAPRAPEALTPVQIFRNLVCPVISNAAEGPTATQLAWTISWVFADWVTFHRHDLWSAISKWLTFRHTSNRQTYNKPRAQWFGCNIRVCGANVFCPDNAAMGLDNLFRDRQAKAGVITKLIFRARCIEPVENFV